MIATAGTLTYEDVRADFNDQPIDFYGTHAGFVGPGRRSTRRSRRWPGPTQRPVHRPHPPASRPPHHVGPTKGKNALYADSDRVVYFDAQGGTLANNHFSGSYPCAPVGGKTYSLGLWVVPPRVVDFT